MPTIDLLIHIRGNEGVAVDIALSAASATVVVPLTEQPFAALVAGDTPEGRHGRVVFWPRHAATMDRDEFWRLAETQRAAEFERSQERAALNRAEVDLAALLAERA